MRNQVNEVTVGIGGTYNFAGYEWLVLEVQEGKALLLSKYVLREREYHAFESVTWETSDMRNYLNNEFYDSFAEPDKARIAETKVINNNNPWFGTEGGNDTTDKIFLLSLEEVVKYFGDSGQLANLSYPDKWGFSDRYDEARATTNIRGQISSWWLRSPGHYPLPGRYSYGTKNVAIWFNGKVHVYGDDVDRWLGGARPALWININNYDITSNTHMCNDNCGYRLELNLGMKNAITPVFNELEEWILKEAS